MRIFLKKKFFSFIEIKSFVFFLLFQHLFEFLNHIHEYNYLMFDLFVAKIMMNVEDGQLKSNKKHYLILSKKKLRLSEN